MIRVQNLTKRYTTYDREPGLAGSMKSLFVRKTKVKEALKDVSFEIPTGEIVGYIGPNGAGKSTTIKILTGILTPTDGEVVVNGYVPFKQRRQFSREIGVVFGQRSQLWWDLPAIESLNFMKYIYKIPEAEFKHNLQMVNDLLGLHEFSSTPVRQLSLGQRMRVEISVALLHNPKVLFLDEPTIGLDVMAKLKIREFIKQINREKKVTILLTTHDMDDIEELCDRVIVIDDGKIFYDGGIRAFASKLGYQKELVIQTAQLDFLPDLQDLRCPHQLNGQQLTVQFNPSDVSAMELIPQIASKLEIMDLTVRDIEIEQVLQTLFTGREI